MLGNKQRRAKDSILTAGSLMAILWASRCSASGKSRAIKNADAAAGVQKLRCLTMYLHIVRF